MEKGTQDVEVYLKGVPVVQVNASLASSWEPSEKFLQIGSVSKLFMFDGALECSLHTINRV